MKNRQRKKGPGIVVLVPGEVREAFKAATWARGISMQQALVDMIIKYLDELPPNYPGYKPEGWSGVPLRPVTRRLE